MTNEVTTCAALLRDVMEDALITCDELRAEGIPEDVLTALPLLTHDEGIPYGDDVTAPKDDPIARAGKLADLRHNSDLSRVEKYRKVTKFLLPEE